MDRYLGHWPESYSSFYNPMSNDDLYVEPGDIQEYDNHYSPITDFTDITGFVHPSVPTNFHQVVDPSDDSDLSHAQNSLYLTLCRTSISQRQQSIPQLHIDTQLSPYQINDIESSTASSSSFPRVLQTPFFQSRLSQQVPVHISSPQSATADIAMLMPEFEKKSPLPTSPLSCYSLNVEGDTLNTPISPLPLEQDIVTQLPMSHIVEWKRTIELCGTNDFVPQVVYQPYTEADRKRYIRDVELHETIFFQSDGSPELGISLDDIMKQRLKHLKDKDDRMFVGCGPSVSIRIQWPGYAPWSKQIPTMDFKNPKGPITRAKLAKNIATCIRRFAEAVQDKPMEAESDPTWKIGKRHIKVDDLILVSLHHVSKGSWQPQLRLRSPSATISHQWGVSLPSFLVS